MKGRSNIFKFVTLALCSLYLLSSLGIMMYTCACSNSRQLSFLTGKSEHGCAKKQKQSCCSVKQACQHEQSSQLGKKPCCTTETISLKVEHQPEQARLSVPQADFLQPVILANAVDICPITDPNDIIGSLSHHTFPPKTPLIHQYSCLRL